jgi:hypothetical protein
MWQIVVTEIPWQVQKSKLVATLAALIETKKVPLLADIRDESAEDVRLSSNRGPARSIPKCLWRCCSSSPSLRRALRST